MYLIDDIDINFIFGSEDWDDQNVTGVLWLQTGSSDGCGTRKLDFHWAPCNSNSVGECDAVLCRSHSLKLNQRFIAHAKNIGDIAEFRQCVMKVGLHYVRLQPAYEDHHRRNARRRLASTALRIWTRLLLPIVIVTRVVTMTRIVLSSLARIIPSVRMMTFTRICLRIDHLSKNNKSLQLLLKVCIHWKATPLFIRHKNWYHFPSYLPRDQNSAIKIISGCMKWSLETLMYFSLLKAFEKVLFRYIRKFQSGKERTPISRSKTNHHAFSGSAHCCTIDTEFKVVKN